jgi:hypothetical protein
MKKFWMTEEARHKLNRLEAGATLSGGAAKRPIRCPS